MNKQVVSIEVLKSYFETGKKPTQGQFGALIDAFYHKNETIPQSQIEGLDTTLEAKAETTDLGTKADLDAGNLTDKNIEQWKEKLGVGDVPENMATIDQDDEQGNAYTKEQVDELLENINTENISNADLSLDEGTVRTFDITGAKFQMKGLQDKQADASFNKKIVVNDNGEFAIKEGTDIILQMPMSANLTMNHIFPSATIPDPPKWVENARDIMRNYKNLVFTPFTKADFKGNADMIDNNGNINNTTTTPINSSIKIPADKNWIIRVIFIRITATGYVCLTQTENLKSAIGFELRGGSQADRGGFGIIRRTRLNKAMNDGVGLGLIIKNGSQFILIGHSYYDADSFVINEVADFGDYHIMVNNANVKLEMCFLN